MSASYTANEERANSITHGLGLVFSILGLVLIVIASVRVGTVWHVVSASVFGSTLVLLYTTSTLYHSFQNSRTKQLLQKFDHAAIFLLIAGTYTPFLLVTLRGPWGWSLFGVVGDWRWRGSC
jgi:hemolysin III